MSSKKRRPTQTKLTADKPRATERDIQKAARIAAVAENRRRIQAKVATYREWSAGRKLQKTARLVQYADCASEPDGLDVPLGEIEEQIEGLLGEGFHVDWAARRNKVYLRVWEGKPAIEEPEWSRVFAELPSMDPCDPPDE